jgi:stage V sporulation protein G
VEITEVRIKLMEGSSDRLRGFCSVTFDDSFVVRDLKIIQGNNGPFVAMPSRKLTANCSQCRTKNHLRANYCNHCGEKLKSGGIATDSSGRAKLYADIAHPVNAECREMIQNRVVDELNQELELSTQPGYKSRYDEDFDDDSDFLDEINGSNSSSNAKSTPPDEKSASTESERIDPAAAQPPAPHDPSVSDQ